MNGEKKMFDAGKVLSIVFAAFLTANLSITGYMTASLIDLRIRVAQIEANRFTSNDAQNLMQTLLQTQRDFEKAIAKLPSEIPPQWFKAEVENGLARLERKMDRIESRLDKLEDRGRTK